MPGQFDDAFVNAIARYQNTGDATPFDIGGVVDDSVITQLDVRGNAHSGMAYEEHQSIYQRRPEIPVTTHAFEKFLQMFGSSGSVDYYRKIDSTSVGMQLFVQAVDPCAVRKTGSVHRMYQIKKGIALLQQITADHQEDATCQIRNIAVLDPAAPTADPLLVVENQALPTILGAGNQRYGFAGGTINGNEFVGTLSFSLDVAPQAQILDSDGVVDPSLVFIDQFQPRVTISGINPTWFGNGAGQIPLGGVVTVQATSAFYLRRRKHGTIYYDKTDNQHIKLSFAGMTTVQTGFAGSGRSPGSCDLMIYTAMEGALLPIKIEYNVQIPI